MPLIGPPILRECIPSLPSPSPPGKTLNWAGKPALTVPQNPCTKFFFAVNPETVPKNLRNLLNKSWQYDPLTTLRLIAYLRTLRKPCNEGFYVSALWLYKTHPLTLSCNLREFAAFGSLRDFAEILYRLVNGQSCYYYNTCIGMEDSEIARRAVTKYVQDSTYRFFHDRVSDLFADLLKSDIQSLNSGNVHLLSYASVDCPSIDSSIDRNTLLCESIAKKVFPKDSDPSYRDIQDDHYVYRVRNRLRKEVIGPLRMALQDQSAEKPRQLQDCTAFYMKKAYQKLLKMKDNQSKFKYYQIILSMILKGNTKVFPATPLSVVSRLNGENREEKELEWKDMVEKFSKEGKLRNSVVVCDVSGDMSETAKNVSASMGLMISESSNGPWKGTVYGFNQCLKRHKIKGDDLGSKLNFIKHLICNKKVDIEAILNEILEVGNNMKLSPENRVERVFVFTNKEFRKGVNHSWGWNYRRVWENYEKSGFDRVPEVVFWNIEGLNYSPPASRAVYHNRLTLIKGFSRSLFAFVLNEDVVCRSDEIKSVTTAEDVMKITLSGKEYQNLVVLD